MCRRAARFESAVTNSATILDSTGGARPFSSGWLSYVSYKVLARKRRPQTFEEVVGQNHITQTLVNSIKLNRLGHAFLFSGSRGIGKTTTARILAKALNCETGPTPQPCNTCRHCTEITAGISMDVIEIDGASNRGIDEIRELRENVRYSPVSARYKVIIIDEVHMLTREAFNALLKTLEEPPDHVIFILATTEAHKVPVTILSRCQRYDFRRIDIKTLKEYLAEICRLESITIEERTLDALAHMADGGMRDCLSLLDQIISFCGNVIDHDKTMQLLGRIDPELLFDVFKSIASGNGSTALERFAQYIDSGGDETVFNREMMEVTRDLMAVKLGAPPHSPLPDDLAESFSIDQLERMFRIMLELEQSFRLTEFPRLLMDVALVKMSRIQQLTPISELMGKLKDLEVRLTSGADSSAPSPASPPRRPTRPQTIDTPPSPKKDIAPPQPTPSHPTAPLTDMPARPEKKTSDKSADQPIKQSVKPQAAPSSAGPSDEQRAGVPKSPISRSLVDNTALQKLIDALPDDAAPLKGLLFSAAVESFTDSELALVFSPNQNLQYELMNSYDNLPKLFDDASRKAFGSERVIRLRQGDKTAPYSILEHEQIERKQQHDDRLNMAQNHPAVKKALAMFDGRIKDVQLKDKSAPAAVESEELEESTDDE